VNVAVLARRISVIKSASESNQSVISQRCQLACVLRAPPRQYTAWSRKKTFNHLYANFARISRK